MPRWDYRVKVKHFFTTNEDLTSIRKSMKLIANELKKNTCFNEFDYSAFYKIPKGNDIFRPVDYANQLLSRMYDYADEKRIWIE